MPPRKDRVIRMSVSILFGLGDDLDLDQSTEVDGGLCLGEGDEDFRGAGHYELRSVICWEDSGHDRRRANAIVEASEQIGDAISSH